MKEELLSLLRQHALQSNLSKDAERFLQKLRSFVHAPANLREIRRIERFATDQQLTQVVANVLQHQYPVWEHEQTYDKVHYWYCIALLCFQPNERVADQLRDIVSHMIRTSFEDLHLMRRMLDYFPQVPALDSHRQLLQDFYQSLAPKIEAIQWIQTLGLALPQKEWQIGFELSTDGERKFDFDLSAEERDARLEIAVNIFSMARGNGHSWQLAIYNSSRTVEAHWTQPAHNLIHVRGQQYQLPMQPSLLQFSQTLAAIEQVVNARFVRKPIKVYFSAGLRGKEAIARWMGAL